MRKRAFKVTRLVPTQLEWEIFSLSVGACGSESTRLGCKDGAVAEGGVAREVGDRLGQHVRNLHQAEVIDTAGEVDLLDGAKRGLAMLTERRREHRDIAVTTAIPSEMRDGTAIELG